MEKAIESGEDLYEFFFRAKRIGGNVGEQRVTDGIFVDSKVRKEVLTSEKQGKITIGGSIKLIEFVDIGGGVYRARRPR